MSKLYVLARKLHRLFVLAIVALGLAMTITGIFLRYPAFAEKIFPSLNLTLVRFLHNKLSVFFTITLALMSLTGLVMYLYPIILKRKRKQEQPTIQNN